MSSVRHLPVLSWRRMGECNRCGACCRTGDPFKGALGEPEIAGACPYYREDADGIGSCSDRSESNAYYTNGCAFFPSRPANLRDYPRCSYAFVPGM